MATAIDASSQPLTHTVSNGENLTAIGQKYGVNWQDIYSANKAVIGSNPNIIQPNQTLVIPGKTAPASSPTTIGALQGQLADLNAQKAALAKYGVNDTNMLVKDASGNYVPKPAGGATTIAKNGANSNNLGGATITGSDNNGFGSNVNNVGATAADIYGGVYSPDPNSAAAAAAQAASTNGYNPATGAPTEKDAYTTALNEYQDQIDAINSLYAGKRADVTKQYTQMENQRMGSEGALLANSGMAGSTFGNSKTNELGIANTDELRGAQDKVDAEKAAAISQLMGDVRARADKSYSDKLAAYTSGADKTVQYLKDSSARNETNATQVAQNAILKKLDLSDPANKDIVDQIAKSMGVDASFIIDKYRAAKATYDTAQAKQKQDNDKAAADLAKTIADTKNSTAKTNSDIAKNNAEIKKMQSDIANGGTYQTGGLKIGKADLSDIQGVLKNGAASKGLGGSGSDGYANTNTYVTLYNHWIDQGGLAKDFIANFPPKTYLNPQDPSMPTQLKNAINASGVTVNVIPGVQ